MARYGAIGTDVVAGDAVILAGGVNADAVGTSLTIRIVPEPGTALLLALGLARLSVLRRDR